MFLPICRTDIRILDGIAAVDHHVVSYIDSHMTGSRRIVSTLKENQISRFCFGRRYICTAGTKPVCRLPSYIPAVSAVIDYPTDRSCLQIFHLTMPLPEFHSQNHRNLRHWAAYLHQTDNHGSHMSDCNNHTAVLPRHSFCF